MEGDTFYGDFMDLMMKLILRLYGSIYHVFSMNIPDNHQSNFTIKNLHKRYHFSLCLLTVSILTILVIKFAIFSP